MPAAVVSGPATIPYGIAGFPNFNTDVGALAPPINTELVKKSFAMTVQYLLPKGDATLFGLTERHKKETALQIEHGFFAKVMVFPQFTLSAAALIGATSITTYSGAEVIPGGLYRLIGTNTGGGATTTPAVLYETEVILVTAVSGNTLTIQRGIGSTAAAIPIDSTFVHIGNAQADAATRPNSFLTKEVRVVNYTQIFRNTWMLSGTVGAIQNLIGNDNVSKGRAECAQYHAMDIEKSCLFGKRSLVNGAIGTQNAFRTLNGIVSQVTDAQSANLFISGSTQAANIVVANSLVNAVATPGAVSMEDFENWADALANMSYDPSSGVDRTLFVGSVAHKVINRLCRFNSQYQIENGAMNWGLRFTKITLTRLTLTIIEHPLLNTNAMWQRMAIGLDLPSISMAYLPGRDTKAEEFNQKGMAVDSGIDAVGGSLLTELTIMVKNPAGCGMYFNMFRAVKPDGLSAI
jgi:hypothetical protein